MNQLQVFNFEGDQVRILGDSSDPMWVAADIAKVLGIPKSTLSNKLSAMPEDWKRVVKAPTPGGEQTVIALLEPGLYHLIFRSTKPEAIKVQRWVFEEVLPSIRKTGRYELPEKASKRLVVVTELIRLKKENTRHLQLVNICNDLIDYTNGTCGFPQVPVEDAEKLLEAAKMVTYNDCAVADITTALNRALGRA